MIGLFLVLFVGILCGREDAPELLFSDDVLKLTTDTYDKFVQDQKVAFIEFYAPWCGHCKKSVPHVNEFAEKAKEEMPDVKVCAVNCIDNKPVCDMNGVRGYPTIKILFNGELIDYEGARDAESFLGSMKQYTGDLFGNVEALADLEGLELPVVLGLFNDEENRFFGAFSNYALQNLDNKYLVNIGDHGDLGEHFKLEGDEQVILIKNEDGVHRITEDSVTVINVDLLEEFVEEHIQPAYYELTQNSFAKLTKKELPFLMLFVSYNDPKKDQMFDEILEPLGEAMKKKYVVVYTDSDRFGSQWEMMGGTPEYEFPGFAVFSDGKTNFVREGKDFKYEDIRDWAQGILDGTVKPAFKSQPIPEEQKEAVYTLVGDSYVDVVMKDQAKDKFIKFYAPWCGHCKKLAPIWTQLAELLKPLEDKIIIAELDATENNIPDDSIDVKGFPTLVYYSAGKKVPLTYAGDRTLQGFVDFISKSGGAVAAAAVKELMENSDVDLDSFGADL